MSLIKCKGCNKDISRQAKQCPHCGAPLKNKMGCLGCLGIFVIIFILFWAIGSQSTSSYKKEMTANKVIQEKKQAEEPIMRKKKIDWQTVASDLIEAYRGKIISIAQLKYATCWAILSPNISYSEAVNIAEDIGEYIKNVTGETPVVHVFIGKRHIAVARAGSGERYYGEIKIENWAP